MTRTEFYAFDLELERDHENGEPIEKALAVTVMWTDKESDTKIWNDMNAALSRIEVCLTPHLRLPNEPDPDTPKQARGGAVAGVVGNLGDVGSGLFNEP